MGAPHYLVEGLRLAPSSYAHLLAKIDPYKLDSALDPGRFTLREAIAHLADWEPIMRGRIRIAVETPELGVQGIDEGVRAQEQGYASWKVDESLATFVRERAETVEYVKTLSDEELARVAVHSERGPTTALNYAWMMVGHDQYHMEQFARYL